MRSKGMSIWRGVFKQAKEGQGVKIIYMTTKLVV